MNAIDQVWLDMRAGGTVTSQVDPTTGKRTADVLSLPLTFRISHRTKLAVIVECVECPWTSTSAMVPREEHVSTARVQEQLLRDHYHEDHPTIETAETTNAPAN